MAQLYTAFICSLSLSLCLSFWSLFLSLKRILKREKLGSRAADYAFPACNFVLGGSLTFYILMYVRYTYLQRNTRKAAAAGKSPSRKNQTTSYRSRWQYPPALYQLILLPVSFFRVVKTISYKLRAYSHRDRMEWKPKRIQHPASSIQQRGWYSCIL